jgi:hypothetical protein
LAHAFPWECSYKGLAFAQLLGRHGIFLTLAGRPAANSRGGSAGADAGSSPWARIHSMASSSPVHCAARQVKSTELADILGQL